MVDIKVARFFVVVIRAIHAVGPDGIRIDELHHAMVWAFGPAWTRALHVETLLMMEKQGFILVNRATMFVTVSELSEKAIAEDDARMAATPKPNMAAAEG